nr:hypothetical protein CYJ21_01320 [Actinomyces sp. UMB0138]PMC92944.1 hypothetical protein CJ188_08720 [Actinomyces sp. UMB0918]
MSFIDTPGHRQANRSDQLRRGIKKPASKTLRLGRGAGAPSRPANANTNPQITIARTKTVPVRAREKIAQGWAFPSGTICERRSKALIAIAEKSV